MATPEPGHWFLRGVQSAIFYYVSLTPCIEWKYKRKRRNEARKAEKERAQVIFEQPGIIRQPAAFQTNEQWAEELILGPGPPKPWKKDHLLEKLQKRITNEDEPQKDKKDVELNALALQNVVATQSIEKTMSEPVVHPDSMVPENLTGSDSRPSSSDTTVEPSSSQARPSRPTMERRLSTAMENIKDSLRISLHPDKWNWTRYDREDEVLWGLGEKMTRMWNKATSTVQTDTENGGGRKRAATNESDRYDYGRGRFPAVNDLHPSIVSQLPATRAEASWMLLPPPSAAVMAGRMRPGAETGLRKPLCIIGRKQSLRDPDPKAEPYEKDDDINTDVDDHYEDAVEEQFHVQVRRQSDPSPKIPTALFTKDQFISKPRPGSWHFHYVIPTPPV